MIKWLWKNLRGVISMRSQWKRINRKQGARWQHLSRLKAGAFFSLQKKFVRCMKCNNLYLGLVTPSSGWWSPIDATPALTNGIFNKLLQTIYVCILCRLLANCCNVLCTCKYSQVNYTFILTRGYFIQTHI